MICLLVQNDPRVSFKFLCTLFCNAFGKIPNQIAHKVIIPHATSCGGYNVFDPSVSQSVSQSVSPSVLFFLVSATPLKPLNRISWNFVVMKDIMCRCAYPQEILIPFFFRSYALFELRNLAKMKDTTQHSLLAQLLWNCSTEFPETL